MGTFKIIVFVANVSGIMEDDDECGRKNGFQYRSLIPASSWLEIILKFSTSSFPLLRYMG